MTLSAYNKKGKSPEFVGTVSPGQPGIKHENTSQYFKYSLQESSYFSGLVIYLIMVPISASLSD